MADLTKNKADLLLSTDTLSWYGLDIVFDLAKSAGFHGIDLAIWKNLDSRNPKYIKKLVKKYDLPVRIVQVSNKVNAKELNQALDICEENWVKIININPPKYFDIKTYNFIIDNFATYKKHNQNIKFGIINPPEGNFFMLPVPTYHFRNIVEIIKKYWSYLCLDLANINTESLEGEFLKKIKNFIPYISSVYLSDKTKLGKTHIVPWEWIIKLTRVLKYIKNELYDWYFSVKIDIDKNDLADLDKTLLILQKATKYYDENYLKID